MVHTKAFKMTIVIVGMVLITAIVILLFKNKVPVTIKGIDPDEISDEMKILIGQKQAEALKETPKDKSSFPLLIGSEGEPVKRLQKILGIPETGNLTTDVLDKFKASVSDIPNVKDTNKVSEAAVILLENYTKDIEIPSIGDKVVAKKEVRLTDGDKKIKLFGKDEVVGKVESVLGMTATVKAENGKIYTPKISVIKKA